MHIAFLSKESLVFVMRTWAISVFHRLFIWWINLLRFSGLRRRLWVMSDVITAHSNSHNVLSLLAISAGCSQNTKWCHMHNNGAGVLPLLPSGFSILQNREDDFLLYSVSVQEILHNCMNKWSPASSRALKNCLAQKSSCCSSWASSETNF